MQGKTILLVLSGLVAWIASTVCWLYVLRAAPLLIIVGVACLFVGD
jgi:hypothetical protein